LASSLSVIYFFVYGILQWQPTFFIRSYGLTSGELGTLFAVIYGLGGLVGTYLGGEWTSRHAAHNERKQLRAATVLYAGIGIISPVAYLVTNYFLAFALLGVVSLASSLFSGPLIAMIQTLAPARMRAMAIALMFLFANLIGMGLGPLATGAMSDQLRSWAGDESLRYALLILSPGYFWVAWHYWRASKTVTDDLAAILAHDEKWASGDEVSATA
jgi:MFS transporter, Spinster family, sphingosine-1-phosphate transporter